jgi:hypothetical protein
MDAARPRDAAGAALPELGGEGAWRLARLADGRRMWRAGVFS